MPCAYLGTCCVIEGVTRSAVGPCLSHHLIIRPRAYCAVFEPVTRLAAFRSHLPSTACLATVPAIQDQRIAFYASALGLLSLPLDWLLSSSSIGSRFTTTAAKQQRLLASLRLVLLAPLP